jgi:hypothetical protein
MLEKNLRGAAYHPAMDEDEILLRQLQAQRRRSRVIIVGFLCLLGIGPFVPIGWQYYQRWKEDQANKLTAAEAQELRGYLDRMSRERESCDQAWQSARDQIDSLKVSEAPCNASLMAPTSEAAKSYVEYGSIDGNYFGSWSLRLIRKEPIGESSACAFSDWEAKQTRERLDRGDADKDTLAWARRAVVRPGRGYQVVVLVSDESKPMKTGNSFIPGRISGRAFVYSDELRRFVCGGPVEAMSSPNVNIRYSYMKDNFMDQEYKSASAGQAALGRDLEVQVRRAVSEQLHSISNPG